TPYPTLFPYTTLFRSGHEPADGAPTNPFAARSMRPSGLEPPPGLPRTRPSTLRVYQFRHRRSEGEYSRGIYADRGACRRPQVARSEEHTSELQSLAYL